jgi:hypothetical protein
MVNHSFNAEPLSRRFYIISAAGFILNNLGYLLRGQLGADLPALALLGGAAAGLVFYLVLRSLRPSPAALLDSKPASRLWL